VFRNWRVGDPGEFAPKLHATKFYFGADWGFSVDPTVLICCYIEGRTLYVWREVYKVGCEIDNTPALFDTLENGMARAWTITADSARPETISYMQRHGFPKIVGAKKGAGSVKEGVEFLKNYDIVVHPECIHTIDELTMYSYEMDDQTGLVLPYLADEDNNVIDSLRYSVEALRKPRAGLF
jgi:phage terminase large subunit